MKKYIILLVTFIISFSVTAQNQYYYYKGQRIYLTENPLVRFVELQHTVSSTEAINIHEILARYCWRTDEYTPYFNKYYIQQDKYI